MVLFVIAVGVGLTTVSDFELTSRGIAVGACSTFLTAHYQIWQGSKQHEFGVSSQQIAYNVMLPQILISLPAALVLDAALPWVKRFMLLPHLGLLEPWWPATDGGGPGGQLRIFSGPGGAPELLANLLLNNILAVGINLTSYYVIGATSPVTYQVVGQLKTVLVVLFGYLLFDIPPPPGWFELRCLGMLLAIVGVFSYGMLKAQLAAQEKEAKASKAKSN